MLKSALIVPPVMLVFIHPIRCCMYCCGPDSSPPAAIRPRGEKPDMKPAASAPPPGMACERRGARGQAGCDGQASRGVGAAAVPQLRLNWHGFVWNHSSRCC
jgi:hypothetical protein